jgi:hypothetical protein
MRMRTAGFLDPDGLIVCNTVPSGFHPAVECAR